MCSLCRCAVCADLRLCRFAQVHLCICALALVHLCIHQFAFWLLLANSVLRCAVETTWWGILSPPSSGSFSTYTQTKHNTSKDKSTNTNTNRMMGNTIASLIRWHFSAAVHSYTVRWRRLWAFWWISSQGPTTIFLTEDRSLNTQCICQSADGATWYTVQGPSYEYWRKRQCMKQSRIHHLNSFQAP